MDGRIEGTGPRGSRHDYWGVVLEAPDAPALARFYAELLGWRIASAEPGFATVGPPDGVAYLGFQTSREYRPPVWPADGGAAQQMMMHLDFEVSDLAAALAHARRLGARPATLQPQESVRVLLDPAGHPFCLYVDDTSGSSPGTAGTVTR
ncbi:VOC family protein [Actinocatenispora rupis]|uniref:Glyoxalase n=1 Tax=Actinocatenispora rupis TaxID=519421 RepID=A0A8J3ND37_9ACTN|nr:VOC family protein [Actinocatenispora rupis]GID11099.1 glyoxalase [Actinocatenispora rupis]